MGLLDMVMPGNPFSGWLDQNRGKVTNAFAGMAGAGNDPRQALQGWVGGLQHGVGVDQENAIIRQKEAEQQAAIEQEKQKQNATIQYLQQQGRADLVAAINGGMPVAEAWKMALTPGGDEAFTLGEGQVRYGPDGRPIATGPSKQPDPFTLGTGEIRFGADGRPLAQGPATVKTESAPTGYRYGATGNLEYIPGGPADPATAGKTTEATRRNQQLASVIVPELQSLVGDPARGIAGTYEALANPQDQARAVGGDFGMAIGQGPSPEYQQARNSLTTIVASYLYSVSGATANPGEVEKQVEVLTPKMGESPQSVAAKKARLQAMVEAVKAAATGTPINIDGPSAPSLGGVGIGIGQTVTVPGGATITRMN